MIERVRMDEIADVTKLAGFEFTKYMEYIPDGEIIAVRALNLKNGSLVLDDVRRIERSVSDSLTRSKLYVNDIVLSYTGTIGETAQITENNRYHLAPNVAKIAPDISKINPQYLFLYIRSNEFKQQMLNHAHGSTQMTVPMKVIRELTVPIFERAIQDNIASILVSIDRKIEKNKRINDNLYAQARAITNQWITENDSDYELLPLSEVAVINPDTYSPKEEWEYVNYLDTSSITDGYIADVQRITPSIEKLPSRARRIIASNDIVFSTVRPNQRHFGIISNPLPNMLASTGFAVIRSMNPLVCNELIYLCLTENVFIEKMQQLAAQSTSTFPSIKPSDLGVCEIPCPKDDSSSNPAETLKAMFALIAANHRENASLAELRDSLLPRLMSGEVDVSDIDI